LDTSEDQEKLLEITSQLNEMARVPLADKSCNIDDFSLITLKGFEKRSLWGNTGSGTGGTWESSLPREGRRSFSSISKGNVTPFDHCGKKLPLEAALAQRLKVFDKLFSTLELALIKKINYFMLNFIKRNDNGTFSDKSGKLYKLIRMNLLAAYRRRDFCPNSKDNLIIWTRTLSDSLLPSSIKYFPCLGVLRTSRGRKTHSLAHLLSGIDIWLTLPASIKTAEYDTITSPYSGNLSDAKQLELYCKRLAKIAGAYIPVFLNGVFGTMKKEINNYYQKNKFPIRVVLNKNGPVVVTYLALITDHAHLSQADKASLIRLARLIHPHWGSIIREALEVFDSLQALCLRSSVTRLINNTDLRLLMATPIWKEILFYLAKPGPKTKKLSVKMLLENGWVVRGVDLKGDLLLKILISSISVLIRNQDVPHMFIQLLVVEYFVRYTSLSEINLVQIVNYFFGNFKQFLFTLGKIRDLKAGSTAPIIGRIACIQERAIKWRIVALVDQWTQIVLSPLERSMMKALEGLEEDCTLDQTKAFRINTWCKNLDSIVCADLSAATDRFPRQFQTEILNMFSEGLGDEWGSFICQRNFKLSSGKLVTYKIGSPMGALTSWTTFALSHHVIVRLAKLFSYISLPTSNSYYILDIEEVHTRIVSDPSLFHKFTTTSRVLHRLDKISSGNYLILGDDVSFVDGMFKFHYLTSVWTQYKNILDCFGVDVSLTKSTFPYDGRPVIGEFAKQQFIGDGVYSPVPINSIKSRGDNEGYITLFRYYLENFLQDKLELRLFCVSIRRFFNRRKILTAAYLLNYWLMLAEEDEFLLIKRKQVHKYVQDRLSQMWGLNKFSLLLTEKLLMYHLMKQLIYDKSRRDLSISTFNLLDYCHLAILLSPYRECLSFSRFDTSAVFAPLSQLDLMSAHIETLVRENERNSTIIGSSRANFMLRILTFSGIHKAPKKVIKDFQELTKTLGSLELPWRKSKWEPSDKDVSPQSVWIKTSVLILGLITEKGNLKTMHLEDFDRLKAKFLKDFEVVTKKSFLDTRAPIRHMTKATLQEPQTARQRALARLISQRFKSDPETVFQRLDTPLQKRRVERVILPSVAKRHSDIQSRMSLFLRLRKLQEKK
jgi:hypothetical protein